MSNDERSSEFETNDNITSCASSAEVDFSYSPTKTPQEENTMIPFTERQQEVFVSEDSERQILLLMLLAQVCALHDATPRTFTVHVLSLFERGILDHQSIRFLFDLDLVRERKEESPFIKFKYIRNDSFVFFFLGSSRCLSRF